MAVGRLSGWLTPGLTGLGLVAAIVLPLVLWVWVYPGATIWPGLVGNFTATFIAFGVALAWDRRRRETDRIDAETQQARELDKAAGDELARRGTEASRRFAAIQKELETNRVSISDVQCYLPTHKILLPQLLTESWEASRESLGRIVSDYDLLADLAHVYGRLQELQWRLRFRLDFLYRADLDNITAPLAAELSDELQGLAERVKQQVARPDVQPLGFVHKATGTVAIRLVGEGAEEVQRP